MSKPIWLLDVDGVVNAASFYPHRYGWRDADWRTVEAPAEVGSFTVRVAEPVLEYLRHVHDNGLAEIRWHTTWQEWALALAAVLSLPDFPVVPAPEFNDEANRYRRGHGDWWKVPAAARAIAEGRPVVWADDDAKTELTAEQRSVLDAAGVLLVIPDTRAGLRERDLKRIDEWLLRHSVAATEPVTVTP